MPTFDIAKENNIDLNSFRANSIKGMFDIETNKIIEHFKGDLSIENKQWNIGIIYGASGTGKSTITKEIFGKINNFEYKNNAVIDDMPTNKTVKEIVKMFCSVGFASPPDWLKPYNVLSNGEKMRVDLANALLQDEKTIIFDEYTSVVNREVAKIASVAVQKTVRKSNKQFIAVSCHDDIIDWLEPDWIFCTNNMTFEWVKKKDQKSNVKYINAINHYGTYLKSIII